MNNPTVPPPPDQLPLEVFFVLQVARIHSYLYPHWIFHSIGPRKPSMVEQEYSHLRTE